MILLSVHFPVWLLFLQAYLSLAAIQGLLQLSLQRGNLVLQSGILPSQAVHLAAQGLP